MVDDLRDGAFLVLGDPLLGTNEIASALTGRGLGQRGMHTFDWNPGSAAALTDINRRIEQQGVAGLEPDPALAAFARAHGTGAVAVVTHFCPVGRDLLSALPNLRLVATVRAGTENIDLAALDERDITLVANPGRNANAVAETTVGLMLAHLRRIATGHHRLLTNGWRDDPLEVERYRELTDKTVGLVGFGHVGRLVRRRLRGFDVRVLVYDPFLGPDEPAAHDVEAVSLDRLFAEADVVSLHARLSAETRNLLGPRELALLKPTAIVVNTARAELVDEAALVDVLEGRRIMGAALDVFATEPLPADHPFRRLDNVTLMPHVAGVSKEVFEGAAALLAARLDTMFRSPARSASARPGQIAVGRTPPR